MHRDVKTLNCPFRAHLVLAKACFPDKTQEASTYSECLPFRYLLYSGRSKSKFQSIALISLLKTFAMKTPDKSIFGAKGHQIRKN